MTSSRRRCLSRCAVRGVAFGFSGVSVDREDSDQTMGVGDVEIPRDTTHLEAKKAGASRRR